MSATTKMSRPNTKGPPVTSDTGDPIVMVITASEGENGPGFSTRAYGATHSLTNEDLLGLVGLMAASVIIPAIEEHGYDPDLIPAAMEMVRSGMERAFIDRMGGVVELGKSAIVAPN